MQNLHLEISPDAQDTLSVQPGQKGFWAGFVRPDNGQFILASQSDSWVVYLANRARYTNTRKTSYAQDILVENEHDKTHESKDQNIVTGRADTRVSEAVRKGDTTVRNSVDVVKHKREDHKQEAAEQKKAKRHASKVEAKRHEAAAKPNELVH